MTEAPTHPFQPHRLELIPSHAGLVNLGASSGTSSGDVIDLLTRQPVRRSPVRSGRDNDVAASGRAEGEYLAARVRLVESILRSATPARPDRLFPGPGGNAAVTFGRGAAGVLWTLAEVGLDVPEELVDWLARSAPRIDERRVGLFDGAAGVALTLDRLGRPEEAQELWRRVEQVPLSQVDATVARGLAGMGLALLERAPISDEQHLMARLAEVAGELGRRVCHGGLGRGLLHGGAGAALFLLELFEVTEDDALLVPVEAALLHDLALMGWGPLSTPGSPAVWWQEPVLGKGSAGLAMVLREAAEHLDARWISDAQEWIATACECYVPDRPGLFDGAAGTAVALWYLRRTSWDTPIQRRSLMAPQLGRLGLLGEAGERLSGVSLGSGAAGVLLAVETLLGPEERRLPFFW